MNDRKSDEIDSQDEFEDEKISHIESEEDKISLIKNLEFIPGKSGARYKKFCAFTIQPQNYPNAVNIVRLSFFKIIFKLFFFFNQFC